MLPIDRATLSGLDGLQLNALPVPYVGSPLQAVLYLLLLNPGLAPESERLHDAYSEQNRLGLTFRSRVPFWPLDPALAGVSGHTWWAQRFRRLADEVGWDTVRERVMCVQFFPYHSLTFSVPRVRPPSQTFSFGLVRDAAREGRAIVIGRGRKLWAQAVPELATGHYDLVNPRAVFITPKNVAGDRFGELVRQLKQG